MSRNESNQEAYAAFVRSKGDQQSDVTFGDGAKVTVKAENTPGQASGTKAEAIFGDGLVKVTMGKDASVNMEAGGSGLPDEKKMMFIAQLESGVLTMPHGEIADFVEELRKPHGIYVASDLAFADLEKLRKELSKIKGVQLEKFLEFAQRFKSANKPPPPPSGMYN